MSDLRGNKRVDQEFRPARAQHRQPQRPIRRRALGEGGKSSRRRDRTGLSVARGTSVPSTAASAYVRAVLRRRVEPNIRTVYTADAEPQKPRERRGGLAIDQLMASLDTQDARPRARGDREDGSRSVQRYARGDSGLCVRREPGKVILNLVAFGREFR